MDVVCKYYYGDIEEIEYVDFINNSLFVKEYFYLMVGIKNVLFLCFNDVSSEFVRFIIIVKFYSLKEFDFLYNRLMLMSMVLKWVIFFDEYCYYYCFVVVLVNVIFIIILLDFRWFFFGIEVWWDFDDEIGFDNFILKDQMRIYVFFLRCGMYYMIIKMNDFNFGLQYKYCVYIIFGVIVFFCYLLVFDFRFENVSLIVIGI